MLTFKRTSAHQASRPVASFGAAFVLTVMASSIAWTSARAQDASISGCVETWHSFNCVTRWGPAGDPFVRLVPKPVDPADKARAIEREHRWVDLCRPVIRQDRYGVGRYQYAAPGCEFGIGEY